jgi:ABC-type uncharacterized transport system permease subunit
LPDGGTGGIIFALRGNNPFEALYVYFIEPLTALWSVEQLMVKASPLILIGAGLAVAYRPMSGTSAPRAN